MHEFYMGVPNCSLVCVDLHYLSMGCNAFINCRSNKKNCLTFLAAVFFICVKFVTILSNIWIHGSTKFFIYFEIMNITTPRGVGGGAGGLVQLMYVLYGMYNLVLLLHRLRENPPSISRDAAFPSLNFFGNFVPIDNLKAS
jgi:hypothetical protein